MDRLLFRSKLWFSILYGMIGLCVGAFAQQSVFIPNGNAQIHCRVFGEGKPLLIINGGPGMNSDGFVPLATEFGKHRLAIIYDQRGTGKSTVTPIDSTTITMDAMIADIEAIRKHFAFQKWDVLGQSFGGMVASYYAVHCPRAIDHLVLCASGGIDLELREKVGNRISERLTAAQRDSILYWDAEIAQGDTSFHARLRRGYALAPAYLVNPSHIPAIAMRLTQGNFTINSLMWEDLERIHFDCSSGLRKFKRPVLILQGQQDILPENIARKTAQLLPHAKLIWLDECAHYAWLDRPDIFWPAVEDFLK